MEHLVQEVDRDETPGTWTSVEACDMANAAAVFFAGRKGPACAIVRGPTQEGVLLFREDHIETNDDLFERGGPLRCARPCVECAGGGHHFVEVITGDHLENPEHEAAKRGVTAWLLCKHCDGWAEYDYGEGICDAVESAMGECWP